MPNTTIRPFAPNGGPSSQTQQGTVYDGPAITVGGGTVYSGPTAGGTVYGGQAAGTVYNPSRQNAGQVSNTFGPSPAAKKGGAIFFSIAGLTAFKTFLIFTGISLLAGKAPATATIGPEQVTGIVLINALVVGVFVLLGIFARNGSKGAFVIGMLLYGADAVLLLFSGDPSTHVVAVAVHGFLLLGLARNLSQLP